MITYQTDHYLINTHIKAIMNIEPNHIIIKTIIFGSNNDDYAHVTEVNMKNAIVKTRRHFYSLAPSTPAPSFAPSLEPPIAPSLASS